VLPAARQAAAAGGGGGGGGERRGAGVRVGPQGVGHAGVGVVVGEQVLLDGGRVDGAVDGAVAGAVLLRLATREVVDAACLGGSRIKDVCVCVFFIYFLSGNLEDFCFVLFGDTYGDKAVIAPKQCRIGGSWHLGHAR